MRKIIYQGGCLLEPTTVDFDEFIPNPQSFEVRQLANGDVELSFINDDRKIVRAIISPRAQIRTTRLLLDCLRQQGLIDEKVFYPDAP